MNRHGAKKKLQAIAGAETVTIETLDEIFEPGALESLLAAFEGDYHGILIAAANPTAVLPAGLARAFAEAPTTWLALKLPSN